jgi:hypothetical protein
LGGRDGVAGLGSVQLVAAAQQQPAQHSRGAEGVPSRRAGGAAGRWLLGPFSPDPAAAALPVDARLLAASRAAAWAGASQQAHTHVCVCRHCTNRARRPSHHPVGACPLGWPRWGSTPLGTTGATGGPPQPHGHTAVGACFQHHSCACQQAPAASDAGTASGWRRAQPAFWGALRAAARSCTLRTGHMHESLCKSCRPHAVRQRNAAQSCPTRRPGARHTNAAFRMQNRAPRNPTCLHMHMPSPPTQGRRDAVTHTRTHTLRSGGCAHGRRHWRQSRGCLGSVPPASQRKPRMLGGNPLVVIQPDAAWSDTATQSGVVQREGAVGMARRPAARPAWTRRPAVARPRP